MKLLQYTKPIYVRFLLCLFLLLLASTLQGAGLEEEISTEEYLFVQGIIQSVSIEDQTITVKQKKGPKISFSIDKDTLFNGFYKLTELQPRQKIKIWYLSDQQRNRALKILKPPDLGC